MPERRFSIWQAKVRDLNTDFSTNVPCCTMQVSCIPRPLYISALVCEVRSKGIVV